MHVSLPQLIYLFEINPKQAWQVWQHVKKHPNKANGGLFNLTTLLGMDTPQGWNIEQFKHLLEPLYNAYHNGKPAAFVKSLYNLSYDYLLLGYLLWEDWPQILRYARIFYDNQGNMVKPSSYGAIVEYLKNDDSVFGKKLREHLKAQIH